VASHFQKLSVKEIRRETADCISISLDVPDGLKETFAYAQGQNITLRATINGVDLRRSYSICSAPHEQELRVAIKRVEGGVFSTWANRELKKGDALEILPPSGKFNTALDHVQKKNYLAFAAGSGITPVISIIKTTLHKEPKSRVTLVYGNRSRSSIIFFEELEGLKNKYVDRFTFINILSKEKTDALLNFGRIDVAKLNQLARLIDYTLVDETFICGPEEMIFCVKKFLEEKGMEKRKIHFELFTTPGKEQAAKRTINKGDNQGPKCNIEIRLDGRSFEFDLSFSSELSILEAALKTGADLPFACKGGVCCTCKAKLLRGQVEMDACWGLEQEEIEQGYILTCQAHPTTDQVVVDFDIK
jgi:ring-1,2-phenylacetyl-CoA epoxidase subunit PaaE